MLVGAMRGLTGAGFWVQKSAEVKMSRYWTHTRPHVESKGHGPAYQHDGGKILKDTETDPPYNANIGPDGPDMNVVGFPVVKAFVKAKFMYGITNTRPSDMAGPLRENGKFYSDEAFKTQQTEVGGIISNVAGAIGSALNDANKEDPLKVYEPSGRNSGSAPVQTEFPGQVRRRR